MGIYIHKIVITDNQTISAQFILRNLGRMTAITSLILDDVHRCLYFFEHFFYNLAVS